MVSAIIFLLHALFIITVFWLKWKREELSSGFINVAFIVIIFSIGWPIATMITKAIVPDYSFFTKDFNMDTVALLILTIAEIPFYWFYYKDIRKVTEAETGK